MNRRILCVASAALFAMSAGFELGRVVLGRPWPNVAPLLSHLVSLGVAAVWLVTALVQLQSLRDERRASVAQSLAIGSILLMVCHGAIVRVFGSYLALTYFALGLAQILLVRHGFKGASSPRPARA